jgi:hypothetical protein
MGSQNNEDLYLLQGVGSEEDAVRHYYASDFYEDSSEAASGDGSESESSYDSSIMEELPEPMREVPQLTGFLWNCGMPGCAYSFDVRDTGLEHGTIPAWQTFNVTVFNHQKTHLREMSIEAVPRKRGKVYLFLLLFPCLSDLRILYRDLDCNELIKDDRGFLQFFNLQS